MDVGLSGTANSSGGSSWDLTLAPSVDYFVLRNLSVGGYVMYEHDYVTPPYNPPVIAVANAGKYAYNLFGVGPRIGYHIRFNDRLSAWPKLSLVFSDSTTTGGFWTESVLVEVDVPLLLHLAPHFFAGLGPGVHSALWTAQHGFGQTHTGLRETTYGLFFTLGGWIVPG
jgi:hypothetical protein